MKTEHKKIMGILDTYLNKYPNQRFFQALVNIGVINYIKDFKMDPMVQDDFYLTDEKMLARVLEKYQELLNKELTK